MPDHNYHDEDLFNPETRHEQSDVPMRPLWWALIIFIVFAIVTHIVLGFFFKGLVRFERSRAEAPNSAVARPASADVPQNQPLLQPFPHKEGAAAEMPPPYDTPVADLIKMRQHEKAVLTSYGWVDRQQGTAHIPIDEAKEIMAARLAVAGQTGAQAQVTASETTPSAGATPATDTQAAAPTATPAGEGSAQ